MNPLNDLKRFLAHLMYSDRIIQTLLNFVNLQNKRSLKVVKPIQYNVLSCELKTIDTNSNSNEPTRPDLLLPRDLPGPFPSRDIMHINNTLQRKLFLSTLRNEIFIFGNSLYSTHFNQVSSWAIKQVWKPIIQKRLVTPLSSGR